MAHLEAATKAPLAVVLPSLLSFSFVEQNGSLPSNWLPVAKNYHQAAKLDDNSSVRITPPEGESKALSDGNIIENLLSISQIPPRTDSIDEWVRFSYSLATKNAPELQKSLLKLESSLTLRTYLASRHTVTLADIAVWATIRGNHVASSLAKKLYVNVARWYNFIEASSPWISQTIADFTAAESADRAKAKAAASAAGASFEIIDMPDVEGPMVTRFPPEPSGYLHIGHAKAALLNEYFARKKAGGVLICRWDDTNPSNESMDFQDAIKEDLALMEIIPDKLSYSSDYFQQMHDLAIQLIKDGKAFADDSALGKGDESRKNRLPSPRRDMSIEETLQRFEEMRTGSTEGQRWCLRARIAYDSPNGTLRDPVIYRCNLTPHHRTGTEWKIYPTYDFCAPILDSIEGVTLALRTNEYRDRNVQYEWMQKNLNLRAVPIWDFSRLNFIRTVLSKRKLTRIVADGKVWGWDDPRMPTIRGIVRRGMTVPALREFILAQGPSRNVVNLEWGTFWATNKKHVDPVAPRYTAVESKDAVTCDVTLPDGSAPASTELSVPKYVKNLSLGNRSVQTAKSVIIEQVDAQTLKEGEMVTLMNWGNAIVQSITRDDTTVKGVALQFQPESRDFKNTKKFTWLAAVEDNMIPAQLMDFDHLIIKDKLEPTDVLEECLNPVTQTVTEAFTDRDTKALAKGAIVQLERKAYYRLDTPYSDAKTPMVFFRIPAK